MHWTPALTSMVLCMLFRGSAPLDNGLARTPPMGWMSWERYRCTTDCKTWPDSCINDRLYIEAGKKLVELGFKDAGYQYVSIDDCWTEKSRDPITKQLRGDHLRFPRGMKFVGDQLHALGLKYGIYGDIGTLTCGGYPGTKGYFDLDSQTFASWGVDMLKFDGCYEDTAAMKVDYPAMGKSLNATERPILYLCSWPAYLTDTNKLPDYEAIARSCNAWRNYGDIQDSFSSVKDIIDWYSVHYKEIQPYQGPGNFSDADMIIIGDFALSYEEARTQLAFWSIWSVPLIMSNNLHKLREWEIKLLTNKNVLGINQDKLGKMGSVVKKDGNSHIWSKPLSTGCEAVLFAYLSDGGMPVLFNHTLRDLGLNGGPYKVTEVFEGKAKNTFQSSDYFPVKVNVHGVQLFTFCPARPGVAALLAKQRVATLLAVHPEEGDRIML